MPDARRILLAWAEKGHIAAADLPRALALVGVLPSRMAWRRFIDRVTLWMGTVLVAGGLIFFLAYNWKDLGRYPKFAMVELLLVVALAFIWRLGLNRTAGKAVLLGASLVIGALLALIGQTYQTGADTFELFGTWAAMILPWVVVGRFAALWLMWLALVNLAITLYFQTFPSVFGMLFSTDKVLWVLFAVDTVALAVFEATARRGIEWLLPRWIPRLVAIVSGGLATALVMMHILDSRHTSAWAALAWLAWLAAVYIVYRRLTRDVFMLAGGVLSVIIVLATFLADKLPHGDAPVYLMIGLMVIALSAAGGWWLKRVAAEDQR